MSLAKYQALATVVDAGSLTRAAQELGCTQSAVSHSIDSLEKELGFPLLKRTRAGVHLTAEGERLMPAVRALLASAEQLSQTASAIRGLDAGLVRIGTFTSVAVHWLPGVLKEFQTDYPKVEFKLLNGDYHDVEQWLGDGSIDIGFVTVPCAVDCECIPLMEDRLLAILPLNSRFASYPRFPLVECETEPFISLLQSSDHDARRALEAAGVQPNVRFYTKDDYAILAMVEQGLGMSIMPELLLKGRSDRLLTLPLVPEAKRTLGIAIAAGDKAGPATRRFADYVVRYVQNQAETEKRQNIGRKTPQ
ncbi:MAG: LysR family transcriptional regulator [Oscillospiraceae bacterium]|nr:LysR family transcriptional regulator [Oscillospiraceae bacterium]